MLYLTFSYTEVIEIKEVFTHFSLFPSHFSLLPPCDRFSIITSPNLLFCPSLGFYYAWVEAQIPFEWIGLKGKLAPFILWTPYKYRGFRENGEGWRFYAYLISKILKQSNFVQIYCCPAKKLNRCYFFYN